MPEETSQVVLVSADGAKTPIRRDVAVVCSLLLREVLEDEPSSADVELPVEIPKEETVKLVVQYMLRRWQQRAQPIEKPLTGQLEDCCDAIDAEQSRAWVPQQVIDLIAAANFLNFDSLREIASARLASIMMGMSADEVRGLLGVQRDFTDEEEAALRAKHGIGFNES